MYKLMYQEKFKIFYINKNKTYELEISSMKERKGALNRYERMI